ncbi:hypothetical protein QCA50_010435 [Cerrena zonata]|uniref:RING-type domain-containing protein n=1 Tax=Cerrena zonata TaxID=2478898 RepID=A0AAW0GAX2_9APHY
MLIRCAICMDHKPLTALQFLKCGHGNCKQCFQSYIENCPRQLNTTRRQRSYPCPHCRVPFKEVDLHPVFIDLSTSANDEGSGEGESTYSEAVTKQTKYTMEKINSMNSDTPVGSVQRSEKELKKVADAIEREGGDVVQALLDAITLFRDRITPKFALCATQQKELLALKKTIKDRDVQIDTLQNEADQRQALLEDAFEAAEKANNRFNGEKHSNQTLQKELSSFKDVLKKKDEDISGLKGSLQKFKEKESKQTGRILDFKSRVEGLEHTVSDLNAENDRLRDQLRDARLESETQRSVYSETQSHISSDDELDIISSEPDFDFSRSSGPPTPRSQPKKSKVLGSTSSSNIPTPSSSQSRSHSSKDPFGPSSINSASSSSRSISTSTISAPQKPKFASDWSVPNAQLSKISASGSSLKRKRSTVEDTDPVRSNFEKTLGLDRAGKSVSGVLAFGDRRKHSLK